MRLLRWTWRVRRRRIALMAMLVVAVTFFTAIHGMHSSLDVERLEALRTDILRGSADSYQGWLNGIDTGVQQQLRRWSDGAEDAFKATVRSAMPDETVEIMASLAQLLGSLSSSLDDMTMWDLMRGMVMLSYRQIEGGEPLLPLLSSNASDLGEAAQLELTGPAGVAVLHRAARLAKLSSAAYGSLLLYGYMARGSLLDATAAIRSRSVVHDRLRVDGGALLRHTGLARQHVLLQVWDTLRVNMSVPGGSVQLAIPAHFVAADPETRAIVLVVRGTLALRDVLTDLLATPAPFLCGCAHQGMALVAQWFAEDKAIAGALRAALLRYPTFDVVVTGHSLGAGVASLLAMLWQHRPPEFLAAHVRHVDRALKQRDIHAAFAPPLPARHHLRGGAVSPSAARPPTLSAFAFAPPAATSRGLASSCARYAPVLSFVLGDDVVPRLSMQSLATLLQELKRALRSDQEHGQRGSRGANGGSTTASSAPASLGAGAGAGDEPECEPSKPSDAARPAGAIQRDAFVRKVRCRSDAAPTVAARSPADQCSAPRSSTDWRRDALLMVPPGHVMVVQPCQRKRASRLASLLESTPLVLLLPQPTADTSCPLTASSHGIARWGGSILLSRTMLANHMPNRYEDAVRMAAAAAALNASISLGDTADKATLHDKLMELRLRQP